MCKGRGSRRLGDLVQILSSVVSLVQARMNIKMQKRNIGLTLVLLGVLKSSLTLVKARMSIRI